ncbi:MAG TPA: MBOAT family O-acyltransferase [Nitrospirota bacterium]|nr:MBOAT family O-acyltransferase [Nitrospirota bacterium]
MVFNSFAFLVFFPVVTVLYFALPHAVRWLLLLLASCVFYMAFIPKYILILFLTILIDYAAGLFIAGTDSKRKKHLYLVISLVSTVSVLFVFKYFDFLNESVAAVARFLHWNYGIENLKIILPIGLSFHTFQSMSYVIEVYRGNQKVERHFGIYALYVMFYPQLVAGPIERPQNLLHQFRERHDIDYDRVTGGLKRMAFGLFKKVVIADQLALVVNEVYGHPHDYTGFSLMFATFCFSYQIYCDFSGYSDIALGSAQVMGFRLMENFDRPYAAPSVTDFWRRWHISLTSWFRDYLYIPLGGNRVEKSRWYLNIFITFLISGLWHGANWTFIAWGALNGMYLLLSIWAAPLRETVIRLTSMRKHPRLHRTFRAVATFLLISFAWIFFRSNSLGDAVYIITHLFSGLTGVSRSSGVAFNGSVLYFILFMEYVQYTHRMKMGNLFSGMPVLLRWSFYYALVMFIVVYFGASNEQQFIYFQF